MLIVSLIALAEPEAAGVGAHYSRQGLEAGLAVVQ